MITNYFRSHGVVCDAKVWCTKIIIEDREYDEHLGDTSIDICNNIDYLAHRVAGVSISNWVKYRETLDMRFFFESEGSIWNDGKPRRFVIHCAPGKNEYVESNQIITESSHA
jgi:hypothetical protein